MTSGDNRVTARAKRRRPAATGVSISVQGLSALFDGLRRAGVDPRSFLEARGIDPAVLDREDDRISADKLAGAWDAAAAFTGDPLFALHAAELAEAHSFGLFSFLAVTSDTWRHALERVARYFRLITDVGQYELTVREDVATLHFVPQTDAARSSPQLADFVVGVPFTYGSRYLDGFAATEILLPYPAPALRMAHDEFFGVSVRFSAGAVGLVFSTRLLDQPLRSASPQLAALLENVAREKTLALPAPADALAQIRIALRSCLRAGHTSLAQLARRVARSPRSLQRQLALEGTTFAAELDEARHELALALLAQPALALQEVSFLLGFSEPSAFHRAFRRWTGEAPGQYRQSRTHRRDC
ncbi:MAG: AraC family transcriptional regulator ligand-binding domain-containing protein [Deltaproteobacteria bacterium]